MADYMELIHRIRAYLKEEFDRRGDDIVRGHRVDGIITAWAMQQLDRLQAEIHELNK